MKHIAGEIYSIKQQDNLYLNMVRVTKVNVEKWKAFAEDQKKRKDNESALEFGRASCQHQRIINYSTYNSGSFLDSLKYYENLNTEVWVAYASYKPVEDPYEVDIEKIEMCVAVTTSRNAPFISLNGDFRSISALLANKVHEDLENVLYTFAAKIMLKIYPAKKYLMNIPWVDTREALISAFDKNGKKDAVYVMVDTKKDEWCSKAAKKEKGAFLKEFEEAKASLIKSKKDYEEAVHFTYVIEYGERCVRLHFLEQLHAAHTRAVPVNPPVDMKVLEKRSGYDDIFSLIIRDGNTDLCSLSTDPKQKGEYAWFFGHDGGHFETRLLSLPVIVVNLEQLALLKEIAQELNHKKIEVPENELEAIIAQEKDKLEAEKKSLALKDAEEAWLFQERKKKEQEERDKQREIEDQKYLLELSNEMLGDMGSQIEAINQKNSSLISQIRGAFQVLNEFIGVVFKNNMLLIFKNPEASRYIWGSYACDLVNGLVLEASLRTAITFFGNLIQTSLKGEQKFLDIILSDRNALLSLAASIAFRTAFVNFQNHLAQKCWDHYEQQFYMKVANPENQKTITLLKDKGQLKDLKNYASSYASTIFALNNGLPGWGISILCSFLYKCYTSRPTSLGSALTFARGSIGYDKILDSAISAVTLIALASIGKRLLNAQEKDDKIAELNATLELLNKSTATYIGITSILYKQLGKRFKEYNQNPFFTSRSAIMTSISITFLKSLVAMKRPLTYILTATQGHTELIRQVVSTIFSTESFTNPNFLTSYGTCCSEGFIELFMASSGINIQHQTDPGLAIQLKKSYGFEVGRYSKRSDGSKAWQGLASIEEDISIEFGKVYIIKSKSGCGKTTLLKIFAGFSGAHKGSIFRSSELADDKSIQFVPSTEMSGLCLGSTVFEFMTSAMNLTEDCDISAIKKEIESYFKELDLADILPDVDAVLPDTLSNGQMKRVLLVKGFIQGARLLLLDETLNALSAEEKEACATVIQRYVKEKNAAVMCITHEKEIPAGFEDPSVIRFNANTAEPDSVDYKSKFVISCNGPSTSRSNARS